MCMSLVNKELRALLERIIVPLGVDLKPINDVFQCDNRKNFFENKSHGFHPIFYWQRTRGLGFWLFNDSVDVVFSYREDVGYFQFVRLCGESIEVAILCEKIASEVSKIWSHCIVARYCNEEIASQLLTQSFVEKNGFEWNQSSTLDDESFSQIIFPIGKIIYLEGAENRMIRQAVKKHENISLYSFTKKTNIRLDKDFVLGELPLSAKRNNFDEIEINDFINSTFDAVSLIMELEKNEVVFHRILSSKGELKAFAISGNIGSQADMYLFSHIKESRLSTYFLYKILEYQNTQGVRFLNLGGSESSSLHKFKMNFSSNYLINQSHLLIYSK